MAEPLTLSLNQREQQELKRTRDHYKLTYVRKPAAALLKIASGQSGCRVVAQGLRFMMPSHAITGESHDPPVIGCSEGSFSD